MFAGSGIAGLTDARTSGRTYPLPTKITTGEMAKNKKVRKASKKQKKQKKQKRASGKRNNQTTALAVVSVNEIVKPEMYRGKYTLVPTALTEKQIVAIIAPTPKEVILNRPGKGGGRWDYVPGWWIKKKLNFVFGFSHSFEILGERVDGDFITVKGRLTIKDAKTGREIAKKEDYGGAEIKMRRDSGKPLDLGNDFKAAQTDALKRCAVQLGFCMDVYGKAEAQEGGAVVNGPQLPAPKESESQREPARRTVDEELFCHGVGKGGCSKGNVLTKTEFDYSKRIYKKPLCRECQQNSKKA